MLVHAKNMGQVLLNKKCSALLSQVWLSCIRMRRSQDMRRLGHLCEGKFKYSTPSFACFVKISDLRANLLLLKVIYRKVYYIWSRVRRRLLDGLITWNLWTLEPWDMVESRMTRSVQMGVAALHHRRNGRIWWFLALDHLWDSAFRGRDPVWGLSALLLPASRDPAVAEGKRTRMLQKRIRTQLAQTAGHTQVSRSSWIISSSNCSRKTVRDAQGLGA